MPLKQNNETKRCTFKIWFAHKDIADWEDDGHDEDINFVSYFQILSLKIVTFVSRQCAYVEVCRQATLWPCPHMRTWVWSELTMEDLNGSVHLPIYFTFNVNITSVSNEQITTVIVQLCTIAKATKAFTNNNHPWKSTCPCIGKGSKQYEWFS